MRRRPGFSGRSAILIALGVCIGCAGLAYVVFALWPRWPGETAAPNAPALPVIVGGVNFNVPPQAIRISMQRRPGLQSRLDLAFPWPALTFPQQQAGTAEVPPSPPADQVFVTIAEAGSKMPLTERLKTVYSRYVAPEATAGPEGLLVVAFRDATPYQGEDLFFQADQPEAFIARCTRTRGPVPGMCLYEQRVGGSDVTIRFPRDWLGQWSNLPPGFQRLLDMLQPASS